MAPHTAARYCWKSPHTGLLVSDREQTGKLALRKHATYILGDADQSQPPVAELKR